MTAGSRERPGCELVFGVLKTLMVAHQLWGASRGLQLSELCTSLYTSERRLGDLLTYLSGEGLVALDHATGTVRLTADGARNLFGEPRR